MRKLRAVLLMLVLAAGQWPPGRALVVTAAPPAAPGKVAQWIIQQTAGGREAEFLVVLSQQADLSAAATLPTRMARGRYVFATLLHTAQATQGPLLAWLAAQGVPHRSFYIVNLVWVKGDAGLVTQLAARADVARLDANPHVTSPLGQPAYGTALPRAAPDTIEPNIAYVNAPQVWALGYTGQGIVIGAQDTGYQWDHPALKPHYRGWNGSTADHNYNWHDSIHTDNADCDGDSPAPCDDYGHGTHTLGTALGDDNAGSQIGMAPGAQWIGCRNMDDGVGTPATYLECFEWFLAPYPVGGAPQDGNPDLAPDVTNNSWGCPPSEGCAANTLQAAVEAQRAAGIFTVVSAGNNGSDCSTVEDPPAVYDAAYTLGALNTGFDTIASFSSRGPVTVDGSQRRKPDVTAPGTNIRSSVPGNGYAFMSGTSMAVPHAVGAVALLWSARPALRGQIGLTEEILNQAATHINSAVCDVPATTWPNNTYGFGRLDVLAAANSVPSQAGQLNGAVTSTLFGVPLGGAQITATLAATPTLSFALAADASGVYSDTLFAGAYTVTVTYPTHISATVSAVTVISGATTALDFQLAPLYSVLLPLTQNSAIP